MHGKLSSDGDYMRILRDLLRSFRLQPSDAPRLGFKPEEFQHLLEDLSEAKLVYKDVVDPENPEYFICLTGVLKYAEFHSNN